MDNIDYVIIKHFLPLCRATLLGIFNDILQYGYFPKEWKKYRVFFISKGVGRGYRPISMSSCLCKVMERMINIRLNWWLDFHDLMPKSQFGFRRRKSCMDNLSILNAEILKAFQEDAGLPVIFLDVKSAYYNVLNEVLIRRLVNLGLPPKVRRFIRVLVSSRQVVCQYGNLEETRWTFRGLPQGSVFSPTLYSLYMVGLEDCCDPNVRMIQYADDICIYSVDPSLMDGVKGLGRTIVAMEKFMKSSGLALSGEKTQFCVFSQGDKALKKLNPDYKIVVAGFRFGISRKARFEHYSTSTLHVS